MPELPEVETVRRGLAPVMEGVAIARVIQRRPDLRFPFPERFAERLEGRKVLRVGRRAKYLVTDIEGGDTLVMHLGMTGRFSIQHPAPPTASGRSVRATVANDMLALKRAATPHPSPPQQGGRERRVASTSVAAAYVPSPVLPKASVDRVGEGQGRGAGAAYAPAPTQLAEFVHSAGDDSKHDHVTIHMSSGATITYNDARRFGFMLLIPTAELQAHALFADIGIEPLGDELTAAHLASIALGRKTDLKAFLLDQRNIAGLGNIYVVEALHRARLSPKKRASVLALRNGAPSPPAIRLVPEIKAVLQAALQAGGSTLNDYRQTDGSRGEFQDRFAVYGREGQACGHAACKGTIKRIVQAGRSTFYCPKCQR